MLGDLRRALYDAISESPEVHRTWRRLRKEGYNLYLLVDCQRDEEIPVPRQTPRREPVFQIDGSDLAFLKSVGIDPTRRGPRRRST